MNALQINALPINTARLNATLARGSTKRVYPWERYVQDGLIFQLDCARNAVGTNWTDLIGGKVATLTSCTTGEGVVLSSGSKVEFDTIEGAVYWEVTTLNATTEEAQTTTSTTSPSPYSTAGTLYAIRAYSRTLNATEKAKNAAIDKARFASEGIFDAEFDDEFE